MAERLQEYEKLLEELSLRVNERDQTLIRNTMDKACWFLSILRFGSDLP